MKQDRTIKLQPVLDLTAGQALLDELKGKLASGGPLCLDASGVEVMSLPGVQIVLAAIRTKSKVSVVAPSQAFVSAFTDHGISWDSEAEANGADQPPEAEAEPVAAAAPAPALAPAPAAEAAAGTVLPKRILTIDEFEDHARHADADAVEQRLRGASGGRRPGRSRRARPRDVDVVITDINMPKLDGYGVIQHMRERAEYDDLPILVLTTESDNEKKERAREARRDGLHHQAI